MEILQRLPLTQNIGFEDPDDQMELVAFSDNATNVTNIVTGAGGNGGGWW